MEETVSLWHSNLNFILFRRSFFQSVCVLGYCLTPVAAALIICRVILLAPQTKLLFFVRLLTTIMGFIWATYGKKKSFAIIIFRKFKIFFVFFSFAHIPWRQSTRESKTFGCLSNIPVLFYHFLARHFTFVNIKK